METIEDPESLAAKDPEELKIDWEGTGYIASKIFETRTGKKIPSLFSENMILSGKEWKEESDDLELRFPVLWKKYLSGHSA